MALTFDPIFAHDPNNPNTIAKDAAITLFDPADPTKAPITITDPTGSPLPNPITVDAFGMGPAFQHATLERVGWTGAGFTNYLTSYEGMKNTATEAKAAAQTAASAAASSAAAVVTTAAVNGSGRLILTKANAETVDAGSVVGPQGVQGVPGANGANVLPTDTAVKDAIENPASATRGALNATYAPVADTLRLRNLADLAASDRQKSGAASRVNYEDSASFIEPWAGLTNWSSATFGQVSAGRFYSNSQAGNSGANRSFALAAGEELRAVFNVQTIASTTGNGGLIIGVTSDAAGGAFTAGGVTMRGLYFRAGASSDLVTMTDGVSGSRIVAFAGTQDWIVTLTVDASWITMTAVLSTDTTVEYRSKFARNTVNNIAVFNSDSRNLTGHSVGKIGVRKATVTVTPRTGLEGLAPSPNWTTVGNANMRVALPTTYDSRKPAPVVMMFHGNGSNETHFADHVAGKAVANAFLAAGYIVVSAANGPNVSTWGAQAGLDAYYTAYQYVRDHYAIGPVVFYGNSMGGIESLLTLAERRIPGVVAWVGTVPVCNLSANYVGALNAQLFKPTIATAYGIAGDGSDYAAKTVGHDPVLKAGSAFRGVPMWVLVATDDVAVIPSENFDLFQPIVAPYAAELVRVNATGGHSTGAIASNAAAMVAFANKYVTA